MQEKTHLYYINTLEPLAAALDIEIDELMLTKKRTDLTDNTQNNQTAAPCIDERQEAVRRTIEIANDPKRKKGQRLLIVFEILLILTGGFLLAYTAFQEYHLWRMMKWYIDTYRKDPP